MKFKVKILISQYHFPEESELTAWYEHTHIFFSICIYKMCYFYNQKILKSYRKERRSVLLSPTGEL